MTTSVVAKVAGVYVDQTTITVAPSGAADNVAIQDAVNKVNALGGGTVQLLAGTYDIQIAIAMLTGVTLKGVGWNTILRLHNNVAYSNDANLISAVTTTTDGIINWAVRDLQLDGNKANQVSFVFGQDNAWNGVHCIATGSGTIRNFVIENVFTHDNGHHGFFVANQCNDWAIRNNTCTLNGARAMHCHAGGTTAAESSNRYIVSGNTVHDNGSAASAPYSGIFVLYDNTYDSVVSHNICYNERGMGIDISGAEGGVSSSGRMTCVDNIITNCAAGIVFGAGVSKLTIANNVITGISNVVYPTGYGYGIFGNTGGVATAGSHITITGNVITGGSSEGIILNQNASGRWTDIIIANNVVTGNATDTAVAHNGVVVYKATGVVISSNSIYQNGNATNPYPQLRLLDVTNGIVIGNIIDASNINYIPMDSDATCVSLTVCDNWLARSGGGAVMRVLSTTSSVFNNGLNLAPGAGTYGPRFNVQNAGGALAATLLNAPVAGNPAVWLDVIDNNGTHRQIPAW